MRNRELDCGLLLKQIHSTLEKNSNNELRNQGFTFTQVSTLLSIRDYPEEYISLKELEKILHVAQSTTAGIIARLEQKGLVYTFGDSSDKRIKLVKITPEGERCCKEAEESMDRAEELLLSSLTETESIVFKNLLIKVKNSIC